MAMLGIAIWTKLESKDWDSFFGDDGTMVLVANILIAAGVFVMLLGFLGCCGAIM